MLTMLGSERIWSSGLTRRETLRAGALSIFGGATLPNLLHAESIAQSRPDGTRTTPKAKNVIVLYLLGGAPTQDMFDLKPAAPVEVRGEFKPIDTTAPGVRICEHLPKMARWMDRAAVIRSVNHKAGCHNTLPSFTGYEATLDNIVSTKESYPPSMGSVCDYLGMGNEGMPAYVAMPCYLGWGQAIRRPGPYGGFLGKRYDPLFSECKPTVDNPPDKPYHAQPLRGVPLLPAAASNAEMTIDQLSTRRTLLEQIDDQRRRLESATALDLYGRHQRRAFDLLTSSRLKAAFDLEREDWRLRERYGQTLFGQSALVARRLVEAGVRFVNVTWDCYWERLQLQFECWDTHARNFPVLKDYNLPYFDLVFDALMTDLEQRGLLDETLVVVTSDMGRTPKINGNGGRDHWTYCYSTVLAGAGVRGGSVHGASDGQAAFVQHSPVSTGDVCATIYRALGVDPDTLITDPLGRPVPIAHGGRPIETVLA